MPDITAQQLLDAVGNGVSCGVGIARFAKHSADDAPIWFVDNVRGLIPIKDLIVPHSELAMHVGAAGQPILNWACKFNVDGSPQYCGVVYAKGKAGDPISGCGVTDGLPTEVLSHELLTLMERMRGKKS